MALLRSEILNRDFIEKVLRHCEGTSRITVTALRVGRADLRGSLLEERLNVGVEATVKGRSKDYEWIAKVLRPEAAPANYARFQGILETEVCFYKELLPQLIMLKAPLPKTFPLLWGDSQTLNKEILLIENPLQSGFVSALPMQKSGLDLAHVILVVEWLAKFHALSYILMKKHEESKSDRTWTELHPWIRKLNEESFKFGNIADEMDNLGNLGSGLRQRLMSIVATCLKKEAEGEHKKIESLLERQDWLDNLRQQTMSERVERDTDFVTVCHGEPWVGSIYLRYENSDDGNNNGEDPCPLEVALTDFHACSIGRPGIDLAHFLLSSTTREFRKNHLETVLQIYLAELEDVLISQGYSAGVYSAADLRSDYRRGLVMGITFCLFSMPMLTTSDADEVDASQEDFPAGETMMISDDVSGRILDGLHDVIDILENEN